MAQKGITIQIIGIEEAKKKLKNITEEKLQKADDAVKRMGFFIQAEVVESIAGHRAEPVSVDTGRFKNSISATFPAIYTASVETNVDYAKFLEYGTSKMEPRHHFTNTVSRQTSTVKEQIAKAVK